MRKPKITFSINNEILKSARQEFEAKKEEYGSFNHFVELAILHEIKKSSKLGK